MKEPREPPRDKTLNGLVPYVRERVERIMARMEARGFDPVPFEGKRSYKRQEWLYGYGRTHHLGCKRKTWTMNSLHIPGKACDIISKSRFWAWDEFFDCLSQEAHREGMRTLPGDRNHVQWEG